MHSKGRILYSEKTQSKGQSNDGMREHVHSEGKGCCPAVEAARDFPHSVGSGFKKCLSTFANEDQYEVKCKPLVKAAAT